MDCNLVVICSHIGHPETDSISRAMRAGSGSGVSGRSIKLVRPSLVLYFLPRTLISISCNCKWRRFCWNAFEIVAIGLEPIPLEIVKESRRVTYYTRGYWRIRHSFSTRTAVRPFKSNRLRMTCLRLNISLSHFRPMSWALATTDAGGASFSLQK